MTFEHDARTGRVRTDEAGLDRLLAALRGPSDDLAAAAALADDRVAATARAVADPVVQLRCVVAGTARVSDHRAWVVPGAAAFALVVDGPGGGDRFDLLGLAPDQVPAALARLTGIGPRRVRDRAARAVDADLLDDLFHPSGMRRASALTMLGAERAWHVVAALVDDEVCMTVVDGPDGLWLVEGSTLVPTTATVLFRRFAAVLPAVDPIGPAAR